MGKFMSQVRLVERSYDENSGDIVTNTSPETPQSGGSYVEDVHRPDPVLSKPSLSEAAEPAMEAGKVHYLGVGCRVAVGDLYFDDAFLLIGGKVEAGVISARDIGILKSADVTGDIVCTGTVRIYGRYAGGTIRAREVLVYDGADLSAPGVSIVADDVGVQIGVRMEAQVSTNTGRNQG